MMKMVFLVFLSLNLSYASIPRVLITVPGLASLFEHLGMGVFEVSSLQSTTNPHGDLLTLSDRNALKSSDLVIWVGEDYEGGRAERLKNLVEEKRRLTLGDVHGLVKRHHQRCCHGSHSHDYKSDGHWWLSPKRLLSIWPRIVEEVILYFPNSAKRLRSNGEDILHQLKSLDRMCERIHFTNVALSHDSLSYWEEDYSLPCVGIWGDPLLPKQYHQWNTLKQKISFVWLVDAMESRPRLDTTGIEIRVLEHPGTTPGMRYEHLIVHIAQMVSRCSVP